MATFNITTNTNYTNLLSPTDGDIVNVSNGAIFTINTDTVRLVKIECSTIGEIRIENTSTTVPIFVNMGTSSVNGIITANGGARLNVLGDWINIGTSNGMPSQNFTLPVSAGFQQYSRLGGVWVDGEWWPCVMSLVNFDSDETGKVCVHNTTLNRIEFGDGTDGAIPPNGASINVPNIQIRYSDIASTSRYINLDLYTTGTAYLRQCALDGYVGATSTNDFHAGASQWDWDRVCMDVGSSGNTNLRWVWNNPDADSSMIDCCFSRMSGSNREFQWLSVAAKFTLRRITYISYVNSKPLLSGNNTEIDGFKFMIPSTTLEVGMDISGRRSYIKGVRWLSRGGMTVSGTQSVVEDFRCTHRFTRTSEVIADSPCLTLSGESTTLNGMTDWKSSNNYFNPPSGNSLLTLSGLGAKAFNIYDIGDTASTQGRIIIMSGRETGLYDVNIIDNAPRGNIIPSAPHIQMRNVFTSDTNVTSDTNAIMPLMNDADLEYVMSNYRTTKTRILNGVLTSNQNRYIGLTTNGVGSDISDVLILRTDIGRSGGMIIVMFGEEKTREFYTPDPANTGNIYFDNAGKVYIENSGDRFTIEGRKHFGIQSWGDILMDGTNPLNFTVEFRAKEGDGIFGDWYTLTTTNLTTATSGFSNMAVNGVTLQYRITHNDSNLIDNLNMIEVRCVTDPTYTMPYIVKDVYSSGGYTLHKRLDMTDCTIVGDLVFTVAGTYYLTNCKIGSVSNTSGGNVTLVFVGSTNLGTNNGPDITIQGSIVTVKVTVVDENGNPISGARVYCEAGTGGPEVQGTVILNDITDSNGIVENTSYIFTANQPLQKCRVRKGPPSPIYKASNFSGTITLSGLDVTVTMVSDE